MEREASRQHACNAARRQAQPRVVALGPSSAPHHGGEGREGAVDLHALAQAQHLWVHPQPLGARHVYKLQGAGLCVPKGVRTGGAGRRERGCGQGAPFLQYTPSRPPLAAPPPTTRRDTMTRSSSPCSAAGAYCASHTVNSAAVRSCTLPRSIICGQWQGAAGQ
jgi:hypothetical protein